MNEFVRRFVRRAIVSTERLLEREEVSWDVAREGLLSLINELCRDYPECEADIKRAFDPYILRNDIERGHIVDPDSARSGGSRAALARRRHERVVPFFDKTIVRLDRVVFPAKILNVSRSGVCLETSFKPPFGSEIVVGGTAAVVVRHFDRGVGGEFVEIVESTAFGPSIRL